MRTNWVLSEDEKRERLLKKRINAAKREKDRQMGKSNGNFKVYMYKNGIFHPSQ